MIFIPPVIFYFRKKQENPLIFFGILGLISIIFTFFILSTDDEKTTRKFIDESKESEKPILNIISLN